MYIIVGLGNPEKKYDHTRHNIGFAAIDRLADAIGIDVIEKKPNVVIGKGIIEGQKCILAKPLTYMNLSGEAVRYLVDYYKIDPTSELIILSDDISLDVGNLRIRKKGSAGGHNGLKNIIAHLGTEEFVRIRLGVGEKPKGWDLADYVLGRFSAPEEKVLEETCDRAADAIRTIITRGPDAAMNDFNSAKKEQ